MSAVTVYALIVAPPLKVGALHVIVSVPLPAVTFSDVVASGVVAGVDVTDPALDVVPMAFVADTDTLYAVPLVNSVMSQVVLEPSVVHVEGASTPSSAVTV